MCCSIFSYLLHMDNFSFFFVLGQHTRLVIQLSYFFFAAQRNAVPIQRRQNEHHPLENQYAYEINATTNTISNSNTSGCSSSVASSISIFIGILKKFGWIFENLSKKLDNFHVGFFVKVWRILKFYEILYFQL